MTTEKLDLEEEFLVEFAVKKLLASEELTLKNLRKDDNIKADTRKTIQDLKGLVEKIEKSRKAHIVNFIQLKGADTGVAKFFEQINQKAVGN